MAQVGRQGVTWAAAGLPHRTGEKRGKAIGLAPLDVIETALGRARVADLVPGDAVRVSDGGLAEVAACVAVRDDGVSTGAMLRRDALAPGIPAVDMTLPEDQSIVLRHAALAEICGATAARVTGRDLIAAGLADPVRLAPGKRYIVVLDRPGHLPVGGLEITPFIPHQSDVKPLSAETRDALFRQAPRLRYEGAADAREGALASLDAREACLAYRRAWEQVTPADGPAGWQTGDAASSAGLPEMPGAADVVPFLDPSPARIPV